MVELEQTIIGVSRAFTTNNRQSGRLRDSTEGD